MSSPSRIPYTLHRRASSQPYPSSIHPFTSSPLLLFLFLTLLSTQHHQTHTSAQVPSAPFTPVPVWGAGYARTGTHLFVLSGNPVSTGVSQPTDQFISLDLATSWSASAPAWTQLTAGPQQSKFPATFSADGKNMFVFHIPVGTTNTSVYQYSLETSRWTPVMNAAFPHSDALGIGAVTDPNTDLTYFAVGYTDTTRTKMDAWNWKTGQIITTDLPFLTVGDSLTNVFAMRTYYSNVWSVNRKSILYFGGIESTLTGNDSKVSEFIPASKAWSTLLTKGLGPPPRVEHCAAANDDGTRMVVYGGRYATTPVTGAIYVLNTITGDWVTGAPGPARMNPVCTIAGDQFLIWGGQDGTGNLGDGIPMLIYNFATNQWVSNYVPPPSYSKPTTSLPTSTSTSGTAPSSIPTTVEPEKPSNNLPLILGGILGVLVLVLLIIGYILYRRRQQRKEREGKNDQEKKMVISAPTMTDFDEPGDFRGPGYGPGVNEGYREQAPYSKLAGPHGSIKAGRLRGEVDFDAVPGFNQPSARSNPHTTTSAKPAHRRGPEALANEKMMAEDTYEEEDDGVVFEKNLKNIENQQRQLDLRRQLLVLQQQQGQQVTRSAPQQGSPDNPVLQHPQVQQVSRSAPQEGSPVNSESGHWEMLIPPSRGPQRVHGTTADYHPPPPPPPVKRSRVDYPPPPPTVQAYALGSQVSNGNGYDYGGGYGYGDDNSPMPPSYHGGHNPQAIV